MPRAHFEPLQTDHLRLGCPSSCVKCLDSISFSNRQTISPNPVETLCKALSSSAVVSLVLVKFASDREREMITMEASGRIMKQGREKEGQFVVIAIQFQVPIVGLFEENQPT